MDVVIETNLMLNQGCDIKDHQSRVIKIESWDGYLDEIRTGECKTRESFLGNLFGCSVPRNCKVLDFVADENHASCTVVLWNGSIIKKLMYRV